MKRQIYLTIISIITGLVILFSMLGRSGILPIGIGSSQAKQSDLIYLDPNGFHSIDMDLSVADLTVLQNPNHDCYIQYEASSQKAVPQIGVQNDTLQITQENLNQNKLGANTLTLTLAIPAECSLQDLALDLGIGDLEFRQLTAEQFTLHAGTGDLKITDSSFARAEIEAGIGDVTFQNSPITNLTLKAGIGDVELYQLTDLSKYDLDITVGVGDLTVEGASKSGLGRAYKQTGDGTYSYKIENGTGDVTLSSN